MDSHFFPPDRTCRVVPVMQSGQVMITLPDIGDYNRALAAEKEIVLSVPRRMIAKLINGMKKFNEGEFS